MYEYKIEISRFISLDLQIGRASFDATFIMHHQKW